MTRGRKCEFGDCKHHGEITFALVDLCLPHYLMIIDETDAYYKQLMTYDERSNYLEIAHLIPWRRRKRK